MRVLNIYGEKGTAVKSVPIPLCWIDADIWKYVGRKSLLVFLGSQTREIQTIGATRLFFVSGRVAAIAITRKENNDV